MSKNAATNESLQNLLSVRNGIIKNVCGVEDVDSEDLKGVLLETSDGTVIKIEGTGLRVVKLQ